MHVSESDGTVSLEGQVLGGDVAFITAGQLALAALVNPGVAENQNKGSDDTKNDEPQLQRVP